MARKVEKILNIESPNLRVRGSESFTTFKNLESSQLKLLEIALSKIFRTQQHESAVTKEVKDLTMYLVFVVI